MNKPREKYNLTKITKRKKEKEKKKRKKKLTRTRTWLLVLFYGITTLSVIVFNWIIFEMRLLHLRINFYLLRTFCPHPCSFCLFFVYCLFFHYVSAKFHLWPSSGDFTATSDRNDESCNRIPSNYCLP